MAGNGSRHWLEHTPDGLGQNAMAGRVRMNAVVQIEHRISSDTGEQVWHYSPGCSSGGGLTAAFSTNYLFVRDGATAPFGYVFDVPRSGLRIFN